MRAIISADIPVFTSDTQCLLCNVRHRKTKTVLDLELSRYQLNNMEIWKGVKSDIRLLNLQGQPVRKVTLLIEGTVSAGRIFKRSIAPFRKAGLTLETTMDWEQVGGLVTVTAGSLPFIGADLPFVLEVLVRLTRRSLSELNGIQAPFNPYELRQTAGAIYDAKHGDTVAQAILDWFHIRELTVRELPRTEKKVRRVKGRGKSLARI